MPNPFGSIDDVCSRVLNTLGLKDRDPGVTMELSPEEQTLIQNGWSQVGDGVWRHKDAPVDESMSLYFAKWVQRTIVRLDERQDQKWRQNHSTYQMAVSSVHFDAFSD